MGPWPSSPFLLEGSLMADAARILVVDDKLEMATTLADGLTDRGYACQALSSSTQALERVATDSLDLVVTDLRMPGVDGLQLLAASRRFDPDRPVIMMTAFSAVDTAVESIRRGAYHYLTKPFKLDELVVFVERALADLRLRREAARLRRELHDGSASRRLLGESPAMRAVRDMIRRFAGTAAPVLILGETGTGKTAIARALHLESPRSEGRFVSVNCAALPEALLESELCGHVKGAFTGAGSSRPGLLAEASGGTLFLDEVAEIALGLQAKLLHLLEHSSVRPVGSDKETAVDVRIVAATNRDLRAAVKRGSFREDLLYRLDVLSITAPPLRDRREDIPQLVAHFLAEGIARYPMSPVRRFSSEAMAVLASDPWPGNIRELAHAVQRTVLLGSGETVDPADLPTPMGTADDDLVSLDGEVKPIREVHRRYAAWALAQLGGNRTATAQRLGIDIKTLRSWLEPEQPTTKSAVEP
jgi:two-component system response regulator HydG